MSGTHLDAPAGAMSQSLSHLNSALEATYNPRSSNESRQEALKYLETIKTHPEAPYNGYLLAGAKDQQPAVRHFGLSLLDYFLRFQWEDLNAEQHSALRTWIVSLAQDVGDHDPAFVRNKIVQLWVDLAKRCWADTWMDMDQMLQTLWDTQESGLGPRGTVVYKTFVLSVVESLSEEIFVREDAIAGLRQETLGCAYNDIMIPQDLYEEYVSTRTSRLDVRHGKGGWLERLCTFLGLCLQDISSGDETMLTCAIKTMNALKPSTSWISFESVLSTKCIDCLCEALTVKNELLRTVSIEVLYSIYSRPYDPDARDLWYRLTQPLLQSDRIALLRQVYQESLVDPTDIDEQKYTLLKKLSEILAALADYVSHTSQLTSIACDVKEFVSLLLDLAQNDSLAVSIPVIHVMPKLLETQTNARLRTTAYQAASSLLRISSERLLKYDALPEDAKHPAVLFMNEDFETLPERHAFVGNYRRFCVNIVEVITRSEPSQAISHIFGQAVVMLQNGPFTAQRGFAADKFSTKSLPVLEFDAQANVMTSALKGYMSWKADVEKQDSETDYNENAARESLAVQDYLEQWCRSVMDMQIEDPEISRLVTLLIGAVVLRTLSSRTNIAIRAVVYLLMPHCSDNLSIQQYSEAVKVLEGVRIMELQKFAMAFPGTLLGVYTSLEERIVSLLADYKHNDRLTWACHAFLFIINHRAPDIHNDERLARLQGMLKPIYEAWQGPLIINGVASFPAFCNMMRLEDLPDFLTKYHFSEVQDWSMQQLDSTGQTRQTEILASFSDLPLRMTRSMLSATVEKLREGTQSYEVACALWGVVIPIIIPNLLQLMKYAHAFNNMANWCQLPNELQHVMRRILTDRFWQAGISNESRDDFYARVSGSKTSYDGFASTVRGAPRNIRELCYHILYGMTRFKEQFFGLSELPEPLAEALFADALALATHHLHSLLDLGSCLVDRCPPHHRSTFLPPVLRWLVSQLDLKISQEWDSIARATAQSTDDDDLGEEMKNESMLRQLTFSTAVFVSSVFDPHREDHAPVQQQSTTQQPAEGPTLSLRTLALSETTVLEPLLLFCTHALRMRDSRSCTVICRTLCSILPTFHSDEGPAPAIREFVCNEVLRAAIMSLNEPYFADLQRELASLITAIIVLYSNKTSTPRDILMSLPEMRAEKVYRTIDRVCQSTSERQRRALVLGLLEGVRGVSIHESGKISRTPKEARSALQTQYMEVEQQPVVQRGESPGLEGIADLFVSDA
ncbi:karyopherin [Elasticomyces elasticus]|nr:karyopherin [Elasticomyces elasticus]